MKYQVNNTIQIYKVKYRHRPVYQHLSYELSGTRTIHTSSNCVVKIIFCKTPTSPNFEVCAFLWLWTPRPSPTPTRPPQKILTVRRRRRRLATDTHAQTCRDYLGYSETQDESACGSKKTFFTNNSLYKLLFFFGTFLRIYLFVRRVTYVFSLQLHILSDSLVCKGLLSTKYYD